MLMTIPGIQTSKRLAFSPCYILYLQNAKIYSKKTVSLGQILNIVLLNVGNFCLDQYSNKRYSYKKKRLYQHMPLSSRIQIYNNTATEVESLPEEGGTCFPLIVFDLPLLSINKTSCSLKCCKLRFPLIPKMFAVLPHACLLV